MKKDIKWLRDKLLSERERLALSLGEGQETMREFISNNAKHEALVDVLELIDQLDEPEVTLNRAFDKVSEIYPMTKEEVCRHLEQVAAHGGKVTFGEPEVLSQEWIDEHAVAVAYDGMPDGTEVVYVDELENLLVPKQEELESKIKVLIEAYKQEEGAYGERENGWISGFIKDLKNLVEEEPLYYALVKGHEFLADDLNHWNLAVTSKEMFLSDRYVMSGLFSTKMSKSEWNKLGINDSNADFVKVEDVEE